MRLNITSSLLVCVGFAASPVGAADGDFRTGLFGYQFCGAPATFQVDSQDPDSWVFRGYIYVGDADVGDELRITQFADNSLRIQRGWTVGGVPNTQRADTDPPVIEGGMVVFYASVGHGAGCRNAGATTALRMPLEQTAPPAAEQEDPFLEFDLEVFGHTLDQCAESNSRCANRMQAYGTDAQLQIELQCTPRFQLCVGNAQAANAQLEADFAVTGRTLEQCTESNLRCANRMQAYGTDAQLQIELQCTPRFQLCVGNAQAAEAGGGGGNTLSVNLDVDLYDAAEDGNQIGMVPAGTQVVVSQCRFDMCEIAGGGYAGWIYDGPDYDTLDR